MALTKADLIASISKNLSIPKSKCTTLIESMLETIKTTLEEGEDVLGGYRGTSITK